MPGFDFSQIDESPREVQVITMAPQFPDAESVKKGLTKYDPQIDAIVTRAENLEVKDATSRAAALEILSDAKNLFKTVENLRETLKAPALEYGRVVDKTANYFKDRLAKAEATVKAKDLVYKQELDRLQAIEEAKAREVARQLQSKIDAEQAAIKAEAERKAKEAAEKLKTEKDAAARALLERTIQEETAAAESPSPVVVAPAIQAPPKNIKTAAGTLSYTKKWKCRLIDETKVDDRFKVLDIKATTRKAQEAVDNGERNLPGFEVWEDETSSARV